MFIHKSPFKILSIQKWKKNLLAKNFLNYQCFDSIKVLMNETTLSHIDNLQKQQYYKCTPSR